MLAELLHCVHNTLPVCRRTLAKKPPPLSSMPWVITGQDDYIDLLIEGKPPFVNNMSKPLISSIKAVVLVLLYLWRDSVKRSHSASPYKDKDSRRAWGDLNIAIPSQTRHRHQQAEHEEVHKNRSTTSSLHAQAMFGWSCPGSDSEESSPVRVCSVKLSESNETSPLLSFVPLAGSRPLERPQFTAAAACQDVVQGRLKVGDLVLGDGLEKIPLLNRRPGLHAGQVSTRQTETG
ncbi:hypothetical protein KUCAC02_030337 [Chaenocephalus aceratus]|uniref:Uncharacterized protein n=1 Tax=Chaenocephalus aceratus TaxID=36190 RepID=A0ACB9XJS9_CHAAC|nr:hypothetical protein KUCAC02_030337 [Chaenocephalus aceratus]